mmetsp:Transcript_75701/g.215507  ORF Transcript_75701/g.215507 Transcript_75701/m.215507 type:complete len:232 (-) Transcript_75701:734-1429(-)
MPLWLSDTLIEIIVNIVTTMVFTVVTSWARTFGAVQSNGADASALTFRIDAIYYVALFVLWVGSISLETWASYSKTRPGVYDGNVLAIKHVVTGVPAILYGVWSIRLYRLLSAKMRDATAAAGGSSVQRRDANGVLILSQEDRVRRQIRQYLIAIWLFLFMMVAYKVTASVFWYWGKTYYLTPPCSFLGVLEIPYVLGIIIGFSWAAGHRGSSPNKEFEYTGKWCPGEFRL